MRILKFLLIFLVSLIFIGCNHNNNLRKKSFKYEKVTVLNNDTYNGIVKNQLTSDLSFQSEGRITYMPYTKGDFVKKGAVISKLDGVLYQIKKSEEVAKLNEAKIKYRQSKNYYERMTTLHKVGGVSDNDWEDAGFNVETNLAEIKVQEEKIKYLAKELNFTQLVAPYDCYILEKKAELGAYVSIGQSIISIIGSKETQVEIIVDSGIINSLKLDQKVKAIKNGTLYTGIIAHISKSSMNSGGYIIKIVLDKLYPELIEGMNIDIILSENQKIYVPINAIVQEENRNFIYKIIFNGSKNKKLKKENVITGQIQDGMIEVKNLNKDDYILTQGLEHAKDGLNINY